MVVAVLHAYNVEGEELGVLWNGQKAGCLSLRVKRDERVGFGGCWMGGCVCDGLVSITLSLSIYRVFQ